jgi:hypothetical protein
VIGEKPDLPSVDCGNPPQHCGKGIRDEDIHPAKLCTTARKPPQATGSGDESKRKQRGEKATKWTVADQAGYGSSLGYEGSQQAQEPTPQNLLGEAQTGPVAG